MKVCSFAFAFLLWSTSGSADTGVYEGECAAPNIFVDQNTGETYCYRVARYYSEDFPVEGQNNEAEWRVAKNICENKTQLTFGGEHRSATIVTINSALEDKFVFNLLNAEFSKLDKSERLLAIRKVFLGRIRWNMDANHPHHWNQWDDLSDSSYFLYRLPIVKVDRTIFAYMLLDNGEWEVGYRSLQKSDFDNGKFSFVVCKARFNSSSVSSTAQVSNFVYDCVLTSELSTEISGHSEVFCYNVTTIDEKDVLDKEKYTDLASRCEFTNFSYQGEVKRGVLTSLNLVNEDQFVRSVLVLRSFLARRISGKEIFYSGKLLLGLQKDGWRDGSDAALLRDKLPGYRAIQDNMCGFLNENRTWTIEECTSIRARKYGWPVSSHFVVCKARFNATTTTTPTSTTAKRTTRKRGLIFPTWPLPPQSSSRCGGMWTCGVIAAIWMAWMAG